MQSSQIPRVSIITINFRQAEVTCDLLDSLRKVSYPNLEVIIVDNGSLKDETQHFLKHYPSASVIVSEDNLGFSGGNNLGFKQATGDYILLLNNDTIVPPGFLEPMVELLEKNDSAGVVSPRIYFYEQPDVLQYAGFTRIHPLTGRNRCIGFMERDYEGEYLYTAPTASGHGACMLIRAELYEKLGGFPEYYFMYYEEIDFCERAAAVGYQSYFCGASYIHHKQSMSIGRVSPMKTYYLNRNRILFMKKVFGGQRYFIFLTFYLLVSWPVNILRHLMRREFDHIKQLVRAISWNFSSNQKATIPY